MLATRAALLPLRVHAEVAEALASKRAVVALESTIIAHGMPSPHNLECARDVGRVVRSVGAGALCAARQRCVAVRRLSRPRMHAPLAFPAVPATVALLDGEAVVGLTPAELERLADPRTESSKCSRRDLAAVLARGGVGATTVSGTMAIAARAGVRVFATGGIGGVHRGGEDTMDVSADLLELGRTPVCVVCAGVKRSVAGRLVKRRPAATIIHHHSVRSHALSRSNRAHFPPLASSTYHERSRCSRRKVCPSSHGAQTRFPRFTLRIPGCSLR